MLERAVWPRRPSCDANLANGLKSKVQAKFLAHSDCDNVHDDDDNEGTVYQIERSCATIPVYTAANAPHQERKKKGASVRVQLADGVLWPFGSLAKLLLLTGPQCPVLAFARSAGLKLVSGPVTFCLVADHH